MGIVVVSDFRSLEILLMLLWKFAELLLFCYFLAPPCNISFTLSTVFALHTNLNLSLPCPYFRIIHNFKPIYTFDALSHYLHFETYFHVVYIFHKNLVFQPDYLRVKRMMLFFPASFFKSKNDIVIFPCEPFRE